MIAMLQRLSRRHTSAVQQAKEGSPFLRGDPQYTGRMGTPGTPFYRENGDPGSPKFYDTGRPAAVYVSVS